MLRFTLLRPAKRNTKDLCFMASQLVRNVSSSQLRYTDIEWGMSHCNQNKLVPIMELFKQCILP